MGGGPRRQGALDQLPVFLPRCVDVLQSRKLFGRRKVHPERDPRYAYEKRASALRWYAPPREWL